MSGKRDGTEGSTYDESLPTGTVTFVFTDIEGSTRLWEQHPQAMRAVVARHDALLKQAILGHSGYLVKSTGDGCLATFRTAGSAVAAALAMQQALKSDPWEEIQPQVVRVRTGVHTGEAETRAGDYFGSALNRAARLMAVGHGGQVLISNSTAELVRDDLPPGVSLVDLGECRLKDLIRPEHIFQLAHAGLPATFPPILSLDAYPHNLPIQLTSFVGREREMNEARRLLGSTRLLTLTGSGGTGKTRLSLQVAAEVLAEYKDGAWLVELAPLDNPSAIVQAIAMVFDLRGLPGASPQNLITDYLRGKQLLLILDNCEHLIGAAAGLGDHLLHACPHLKLLVTSREALGIAGEVSYRVPSLSLPDQETPTPQTLGRCESAQLFIERAAAANPSFALSADNAAAVAQICRRLDGIPLALELAAARTKAFSVDQIAARLDDRFRLLTGGSRTALPRQQTLRALIDWSYELLPAPECALLRALSVFVNGWAFEAAEAVSPKVDVLDLLPQLVNKSLVLADEQAGQVRYRLLETIRQYARDRLLEAGESAGVRDRHLDYFLALSEQAEPHLRGDQALDWFDRLDPDYDNIQAAMEWGQEQRPEDALHLGGNLLFFWSFRSDRVTATPWLQQTIRRLDALPAVTAAAALQRAHAKAKGLLILGLFALGSGKYPEAESWLSDAIGLFRSVNDKFMLAFTLGEKALIGYFQNDIAAIRSAATEALTIVDQIGERKWRSSTLLLLAIAARMEGDMETRRRYYEELRAGIQQVYHPNHVSILMGMGLDAMAAGEWDAARLYLQRGLELARRIKSRYFVNFTESQLVHITRHQGDLQSAKAGYRRTILLWVNIGERAAVANQLECLAFIARAENESARAARLFGAAEALRDMLQQPMIGDDRSEYEREVASLRGQMDAAALGAATALGATTAFGAAWAEGRAMNMEQAVAYAIGPES